jgi:hypothetical protein
MGISDCLPKFEQESKPLVGMIKSIWVKKTTGANIYYVRVQGFETTEVDNHYQMRSIVRTPYHAVVHTKVCLWCFPLVGAYLLSLPLINHLTVVYPGHNKRPT